MSRLINSWHLAAHIGAATESCGVSTSGLVAGDLVVLEFGPAGEKQVDLISADLVNETLSAITTMSHLAGSSIRP